MAIVSSLLIINFSNVNASTESDEISQIPSQSTDYPGNNKDVVEILFSKATISENDSVHVVGSLKNVGQQSLHSVDVTAHFFDSNNNTVGVTTCCHADPSDIEPGHTSSFDSFSSSDQMTGEPRYFRLSFDWQNDGSINESDNVNPEVTNNVSCKDITTDFTLTSDLECSSDGLNIINQDGLTIDLNGYTLSGPGVQTYKADPSLDELNAGIRLEDSSNISIEGPGIIQNFPAGVLNIGGQDDKISAVTFTQNQIGSFNTGSANTAIEDNLFYSNNIGVASHSSTGTTLTTNLFKANDLAGATFVNSAENQVSFNTIQGSVTGLFFDGQSSDNTVNANNILDNTGVDINNANGIPLKVNNNQFSDNNCNTSVPVGLCLGKVN